MIDPVALSKIQVELVRGETMKWAGRPTPGFRLHPEDRAMIPFSLLWGGFAIVWESIVVVKGAPWFFALWGVPFVVIGQYLIWGRFVYDGWLKKRTYYAVTDRRLIVVQEGWSRKVVSTYLEAIPLIEKEGDRAGSLWFGPKLPAVAGRGQPTRGISRFSVGGVPAFSDIEDLDAVVRLVVELRQKLLDEQNAKT